KRFHNEVRDLDGAGRTTVRLGVVLPPHRPHPHPPLQARLPQDLLQGGDVHPGLAHEAEGGVEDALQLHGGEVDHVHVLRPQDRRRRPLGEHDQEGLLKAGPEARQVREVGRVLPVGVDHHRVQALLLHPGPQPRQPPIVDLFGQMGILWRHLADRCGHLRPGYLSCHLCHPAPYVTPAHRSMGPHARLARRDRTSIKTATIKMKPLMICCQKDSTLSMLRPLSTLAMMSAPKSAPEMLPYPPARLVPPMTQAAMASSSKPFPALAVAALRRAVRMTPARPARRPMRAKICTVTRRT